MRIELINTGSELLLGFTTNTHLNYIAQKLGERGLQLARQTTVGDDRDEMRAVVNEALHRADVLLVTGGLGPTSDDFTRDIVAELCGRPLQRDETVAAFIAERFRRRGLTMPASVEVQALVPQGATVLPNPNGTAPGLFLTHQNCRVFLLPGPPRELRPMFEEHVLPRLPVIPDKTCRILRTTGLPESLVEQRVAPALANLTGLELGYCARPGEVDVRLIGSPTIVADAEQRARTALAGFIYGTGDDRLEAVIVRELTARGHTLAVAESCTGGLLAHRITNISGSSRVFLAGYVTYSNAAKIQMLGVREATLQHHGAVSEPTCREMAEGARLRSGTDYALAITGIAGPTGGTPEKPVGLVFIGLASARTTEVVRHQLSFDRETFKHVATQLALDLLRRHLTSSTT
ncbi:MAG: competence/damage-inducible protein A [Verrucomicrobiae bacterium]|nr:competence/damage-inducible protein A [Verrucomicrobiae bacterium]